MGIAIMAPISSSIHTLARRMVEVAKPTSPDALIVEAWAQGFMVGSILIMLCITVSNYRRGVLLHQLILLEVSTYTIRRRQYCPVKTLNFPSSLSSALSMELSSSSRLQFTVGTFP